MISRRIHFFLLPLVAVLTLSYLRQNEIPLKKVFDQESPSTAKSYLYNFESTRYDESGKLKEIIYSKVARDIAYANEIQLEKPSIHTHSGRSRVWVASADFGVMQKKESFLTLKDNVLVKNDYAGSKIETNELKLNLISRTAETGKAIVISHDDGYTLAEGMKADLESSKVQLLNEVRSTYLGGNR